MEDGELLVVNVRLGLKDLLVVKELKVLQLLQNMLLANLLHDHLVLVVDLVGFLIHDYGLWLFVLVVLEVKLPCLLGWDRVGVH